MESRLKFSVKCGLCEGLVPAQNYESHLFGSHNITTAHGILHNSHFYTILHKSDGLPSPGAIALKADDESGKDIGEQESMVAPPSFQDTR